MRVTVLGATGGIGRAIAAELVSRGHIVQAVSRSGDDVAGTTTAAADLDDPIAAQQVCRDSEIVVMAAQPPYPEWVSRWPGLLDNVIDATAAAGARLVFVDNLYMYAPACGPLNEDSPEHATDPKGMLRRRLGEQLRRAHADGRVRMTIGRFSDYYGPGGTNSGLYVTGIGPALEGKRPRGFVDLDQPHTFHYLDDAARGFATLVEHQEADGRVWVLPAAPAITQRKLLQHVSDLLGTKSPGVIRPWMFAVGGLFDAQIRESRSVTVQYDRPWVVDATAFTDAFGPIELTPHDIAVQRTVSWFQGQHADNAPHAAPHRLPTAS